MKAEKILVPLILAVFVTGCITAKYITKNNSIYSNSKYSFSMPEGWVAYKGNNFVGITHDGRGLQWIYIDSNTARVYFKDDAEKINRNILPSELADLYIAKFKKQNENIDVEVLTNEFSNIAGSPGFKIRMRYKNEKGLAFSHIVYGTLQGEMFYQLSYSATDILHFDRFKPVFEDIVSSFQFTSTKS